jgi:hypothetical protein
MPLSSGPWRRESHRDVMRAAVQREQQARSVGAGEVGDERPYASGRPVLVRHLVAVRMQPAHVVGFAGAARRAGEPAILAQCRLCLAERDEARREGGEVPVGAIPVEPGRGVVLRVRVVVAALRVPELVAHGEHGRAAREEERREQGAHVARARGAHRGIVRRSLDTVVPRVVRVGAVAVALAVGLVVLPLVAHEVAQREPVVGRDEVHRPRGGTSPAGEEVRRGGEARREVADVLAVATPEVPDAVPIAVVPFAPGGRELPEAVAPGADVPRLGDVLQRPEHRVVGDGVEQRCVRVEAAVTASEGRGEVVAEAVDAGPLRPVPQRVEHQLRDRGAVEGERVPGAGVVHVACGITVDEPIVGRVVEAAQRERGTEGIALAAVVEDHVQQDLDPRLVQRRHALAELADAVGDEARIGHHPADRVVAPVVDEPRLGEMPLVDRGRHGEQLHRRDAEPDEVLDRGGVRESGGRTAEMRRHVGMLPGEAAQVHLIDDRVAPRVGRAASCGRASAARRLVPAQPGVPGGEHDRLGHVRRAVRLVARAVRELTALRCVERERPVEGARVRIDEQLRRIEPVSLVGRPGPMRAQAVARARGDAVDRSMEDGADAVEEGDARDLAFPRVVEEADLDARRVLRVDRALRPAFRQRHPQRRWAPGEDAGHGQSALAWRRSRSASSTR